MQLSKVISIHFMISLIHGLAIPDTSDEGSDSSLFTSDTFYLTSNFTVDIESGDVYSSNFSSSLLTSSSSSSVLTSLVKRTNEYACLTFFAIAGTTVFSGGSAAAAWYTIIKSASAEIKDQSDHHNCGIVHKHDHNMKFAYSSSGQNCETTAEEGTIQGALDKAYNKYIKYHNKGVWCMELSHGGKWRGYLLIGPNESWPESLYCGAGNKDTCVSGGKNDIHHKKRDSIIEESNNQTSVYWVDGGLLVNTF